MIRTPVCEILGIQHPIIQAGMGVFTSAELVAAVSNAGALGTLGAANRSVADLRAQLDRIRQLTSRPFVVNHLVTNLNEEAFALTLRSRVPIVSFALGDAGDLVNRAHDAGARVIQQVHTVEQAKQAAEHGVDVIIAQGGEAGGFGQNVAALPLIPQVVDTVRPVPVLAAGGIADGRGLAAALVLGAQGVNLGTRFLASAEAPISEGWKRAILAAASQDAVKVEVWNDIFPTPGRGGFVTVPRALRTPFIERWQRARRSAARNAEQLQGEVGSAMQAGRFHEYAPFSGQTVGLIREVLPAAEIVRRLVREAEQALQAGARLAVAG